VREAPGFSVDAAALVALVDFTVATLCCDTSSIVEATLLALFRVAVFALAFAGAVFVAFRFLVVVGFAFSSVTA
jgi:hypothetical protein